ncbi:LPPG:FO 2-phospho-L-lactate transferase [uncultured Clostridium sp.]|uniref:gluconeogenesis factor YvcK family protein n=1 Tax=uncultured Clostridium sp. TaxID=59620 RepID=UPI00082204CE|nr:gluconeogenesis factor YvcK family protein [uncultured Clostridium sp.]SCJ32177.1 LPPG:FO 2-phospho-L-lactate transferase [uncultured Clostridium sp.]
MILDYLMKPGARIKRWVLLGFVGTILLSLGVGEIFIHREYDLTSKMVFLFLGLLGVVVIVISISEGLKSILRLINSDKINITINDKDVEELIDDERLLVNGPKIVVVGGGTGLSTMLRGLKKYTNNITAIVTVGDDGGGSGKIREDFGMLPPGDIRNCILALADTEPIMEKLLQYRFKEGSLEGQSFGNLFLAAMAGISDNFEEAVQRMSSVLAVTGKVLPVTLDDMKLVAILENGDEIDGESRIPDEAIARESKINKLMINPKNAKPLVDALKAIEDADAIIMGPGSLYTSIIPNLLVTDIADTICKSDAIKIYISNIMTQPGETDDFAASDHLRTLINYGGKKCVQYVIANNGIIPEDIESRYLKEGSKLVELDRDKIKSLGVEIVEDNLVKITKGYVKHDSEYLAEIIMKTVIEKELKWDKEKILEYAYSLQKMRERNKK